MSAWFYEGVQFLVNREGSQQAVARLLQVSQPTVAGYLSRQYMPRLDVAERLLNEIGGDFRRALPTSENMRLDPEERAELRMLRHEGRMMREEIAGMRQAIAATCGRLLSSLPPEELHQVIADATRSQSPSPGSGSSPRGTSAATG